MKGFLKKDLYLTLGYCRSIFLIVIVFIAVGCFQPDNYFFICYPAIMVSLIPVSLLSYDEGEHFCNYASVMPQPRATYVSAKYIIGMICGLICVAVIVLAQVLFARQRGSDIVLLAAVLLTLTLFTPAVVLPFMFKLGVQKGRIVYFVVIGLATAGVILVMNYSAPGSMSDSMLFAWLGAGAVILFAVSWLLSVRFYTKREF